MSNQAEHQKKLDEAYEKSIANLKEVLNKQGMAATYDAQAWGYATIMYVKRLPNGKVEAETAHGEGEYRTHISDDEAQTVYALFSDGEGCWEPGTWE